MNAITRRYNFTTPTGIKGNIEINWSAETFIIITDKLDPIKGNLKERNGYPFTFIREIVSYPIKSQNIETKDYTWLGMPNRLLKMDYEAFQKKWDVSYSSDIKTVLNENLRIIKGEEIERPLKIWDVYEWEGFNY